MAATLVSAMQPELLSDLYER